MNNTILKLSTLLLLTSLTIFAGTTGEASWYGKKFQGKSTASGEAFDMYDYTAAHRTYPFGTILKVTNLKNGKSIDVRVNDRGPYKKSRIVDLSYQAAKEIGLVKSGVAEVEIEEVEENMYPVDAAEEETTEHKKELKTEVKKREIQVQIAAFSTKNNAENFVANQVDDVTIKVLSATSKGKSIYKVVLVYESEEYAKKILKSEKYKGAYIITQS